MSNGLGQWTHPSDSPGNPTSLGCSRVYASEWGGGTRKAEVKSRGPARLRAGVRFHHTSLEAIVIEMRVTVGLFPPPARGSYISPSLHRSTGCRGEIIVIPRLHRLVLATQGRPQSTLVIETSFHCGRTERCVHPHGAQHGLWVPRAAT